MECGAAATLLCASIRNYEVIVGRPCQEVFGRRGRLLADCRLRRSRRSGQTYTMVVKQDGRWLRTTLRPLLGECGVSLGGVVKVWQTVGKLRRRHGLVMSGEPREPGCRIMDWLEGAEHSERRVRQQVSPAGAADCSIAAWCSLERLGWD